MDLDRLIERFQLNHDGQWLYLRYLGQQLKLSRTSGKVLFADREEIPEFDTVITVYNMFYYAKEHPAASGELVPFRLVKRVYPFERAYQKQGDAGYRIPVYPYFDMAVLFWDRDDEFEAQGNMLFDSNITDFVHEENVVCIAADAVRYLSRAAGLEEMKIYAG